MSETETTLESSAEAKLVAVIDPFSPFWRAFEHWAEARRTAIGLGLLRAGAESVETARGKAAMLTEILRFGDEKRETIQSKGDQTHVD